MWLKPFTSCAATHRAAKWRMPSSLLFMVTAAFCRPTVLWCWELEMSDMAYPLPRPNSHTQPFWDGAAQGELRYQCCTACGNVQLIPRSLCEGCQSTELEWKVSEATGTVLTFTVVHRAP